MDAVSNYLPSLDGRLSEDKQRLIVRVIKESGRLCKLQENHELCKDGDSGDCLWIIQDGQIGIWKGERLIVIRRTGEMIGEQAGLAENGKRTATMRTITATTAWRIPVAAIAKSIEIEAAWSKAIAITLSDKLAEATQRRHALQNELVDADNLLSRFVCDYSLGKVRAALSGDADKYVEESAFIWFSDLVGFSREINPEKSAEIAIALRNLMKIQADAISHFGGNIDKFMGDAVMAFWIVEDKSQVSKIANGVATAALESLEGVESEARRLKLAISLRVGIHFGKVIAGNFGSDDRIAHTLIGHDVNLAARYEQVKEAIDQSDLHPIRLSPGSYEMLSTEFKAKFSSMARCRVKHGLEFDVHHGPGAK